MYRPRPGYSPPNNPCIKVWRYVDFVKFMSMIHGSSLFFGRLDTQDDPFEGATPRRLLEKMFADMDWATVTAGGHDPDFIRQEIEASMFTHTRESAYVNCWHMNERESMAMWKVYSGEGLAIQSTYLRLRDSFKAEREKHIHIGEVQYLEPAEDDPGQYHLGAVLHKRRAFEYEREIRAVYLDVAMPDENGILPAISPESRPSGVSVSVDLNTLIEAIYVAPNQSRWFVQLVRDMLDKFGLEGKTVHASALDADPLYFQKGL